MTSLHVDAIGAIEACYAPALTGEAWLGGIAEALSSIDQGSGVRVLSLAMREGNAVSLAGADRGPVPMDWRDVVARWKCASQGLLTAWLSPVPPVDLASRRLARLSAAERSEASAILGEERVKEALGIVAFDPTGIGVLVSVPSLHPIRLPARTIHVLGRVAAHIASAHRLRMRVAVGPPTAHAVEAVLDPSGRVTHAEGPAREPDLREQLALAVRDVERARGRMRRTDPMEAAELWKGLVEGRWSLVDQVESDGRRFILARRNDVGLQDPLALTQRERDVLGCIAVGHSNKYVAYQLGLGPSTVAEHLRRGLAKLGLHSRREVIGLLGPMARPPFVG
jgi:DNA-binding CsgD family transcriptional regulator